MDFQLVTWLTITGLTQIAQRSNIFHPTLHFETAPTATEKNDCKGGDFHVTADSHFYIGYDRLATVAKRLKLRLKLISSCHHGQLLI